jgi:hypothetical protein
MQPSENKLTALFRRGLAIHAPLTWISLAMALFGLITAAGILLDPRVVTGAPVWVKPTKFALSLAIYGATFVWLFSFLKGPARLLRWVGNAVAATALVEMVIIAGQAIRGKESHFNVGTSLDAALFAVMGMTIVMLLIATLTLAVLLLRQKLPDRAFAWSLRLGVLVTVLGMSTGFFMTQPRAAQIQAMQEGRGGRVGGHTFGAEDGGPGLPLLGWSTEAGDMRPAHFIGLHGLQILPFLGFLISRRRRLLESSRVGLVFTSGLAYLGAVAVLASQALRAQPLLGPDALTLGLFAALASAAAASALFFSARREHAPERALAA